MANFTPIPDVPYKYDYADIFRCIAGGKIKAVPTYRELCKKDLFFLLYFGLQRTEINDPDNPRKTLFIVAAIREVEEDHNNTLDLWAREHYKALAIDTPILTPDGWRKHVDLGTGDRVFAPSGEVVSVIAKTGVQHGADCYLVGDVIAAGSHRWPGQVKHRKRIAGDKRDVSYYTQIVITRDMDCVRLPNSEPVVLPIADLPIDPYLLGYWLGNGHSANSRITTGDSEVWALLNWVEIRDTSVEITKTLIGLRPKLRAVGVLENKHIPESYLFAGVSQRLELLRGLMDSDGHVNTRGTATFVNTNERLVDGVYFLANSLGMRAHKRSYDGFWQVGFQAYVDRCPFKVRRKVKRCKVGKPNMRQYTAIPVSSVPVNCIQVEGGQYLAGRELLPTCNSTILTYALPIQEIILNCEERIGIFSHTRPIAKGFLRQIKLTLESPVPVKKWFPDIFHHNPRKEAPKWSEDDGLIVKRKSNAKEASFEAWGLVDGQPTSKHYTIRIYDDVVTGASITNPEQIKKTREAFELSQSLGTDGGVKRVNGTHYSFADLYVELKKRSDYKTRLKPATDDGEPTGKPVFLSAERLDELRKDQGPYVFGCQQLLNPLAYGEQKLKTEWLRYWPARVHTHLNLYIIVDPASEKRKTNDYTTMFVVGLGEDENYYIVTMIRNRLNLTEKGKILFDLHRTYKPLGVGYEKYGMQSDIEHYKDQMEREKYHFEITPLAGPVGKNDRIRALVPLFENNRIYLPDRCFREDDEGKECDLVKVFIDEEYMVFPFSAHDDMLDCLARIRDPDFPMYPPRNKHGNQPRQDTADNDYDPLE